MLPLSIKLLRHCSYQCDEEFSRFVFRQGSLRLPLSKVLSDAGTCNIIDSMITQLEGHNRYFVQERVITLAHGLLAACLGAKVICPVIDGVLRVLPASVLEQFN